MKFYVHDIGRDGHKVVVIDDAINEAAALIDLAAEAPFPPVAGNSYPGIRRHLDSGAANEAAYVERLRALATPVMDEVFGIPAFRIVQAAFSLITRPPHESHPLTRIPHYDSVNASRYALLHFLSPEPQGGTSFYRQTDTGIEQISDANRLRFEQAGLRSLQSKGPPDGYIAGTTADFAQTAFFEGRFNRVLIYSGALLHSAQIPADFTYSADPRTGRLTTNLFLQA